MTVGAIVWTVIAAAWLAWLVVSRLVRPLPGVGSLAHAFLGSWLGRLIALAAWAEAGWHLFGQRP
ncbi:MAG TPA: hypothetical protein VMD28_02645 [Acidimicrobiales bacterium]|nr:hypothetical protein [Acidimicrobiales bacterium]